MTELHESAGAGPGDARFTVFTDCERAAAAARSFSRPRKPDPHTCLGPSLALLARADRGFARFLAQRTEDQDDRNGDGEETPR
ncbi:hypothetical protein [Streptomyces sp. A5-4]|uniref:hypothetical protein n=1 Tax=Streptomyces sp. A5-4 TaxID=3384771 RepID=UPI003DA82797